MTDAHQEFRLDREHIPRPHRIGPARFVNTETDRAFCEIQRFHEQPHGHCRSMPAAGNQSLENRSFRAPSAEMKHLRIKLVGEFDELFFRHGQRFGFEPVTRFQIIEVTFVHHSQNREQIDAPECATEQ